MFGQARNGAGFEQFVGVIKRQCQPPLAIFFTVQLQIELGFAAVPVQLFGQQPRQPAQGRRIALLVVKHDLKQPLFAGLRQCLDQLFKRHVLMRLCLQGDLPGLRQQFSERQTPVQSGPQHQGVDEETDQAVGFLARTVGAGHTNANVALAAVAVEQRLKRRQQPHERRGVVRMCRGAHRVAQGGIQLEGVTGRAGPFKGRTRVIGGQTQHRVFIAQLPGPVIELAPRLTLRQPLTLPTAVVGIVQGQRGKLQRLTQASRRVQPGELVDQQVQRPTVGNDVVQGQQQVVLVFIELDQHHPIQRPLLQVEQGAGFVLADLPRTGLPLIGWQIADVDEVQVEAGRFVDALHRLPVPFVKARSQCLVALDQLRKTAAQRGLIQLTAQPQRAGDGVRAAGRVQLPQEPQAVLRQGLRQALCTRQRTYGALRRAACLLQRGNLRRERPQRRCFEQQAQAQRQLEFCLQVSDHLRGQNRVAAQQEKVVVGGHLLDLQMFAPHPRDQRFQLAAAPGVRFVRLRRAVGGELRITIKAAIGQTIAAGRTLQFAAGGFGQGAGVEQHHHTRRLLAGLGHGLANGVDQRIGRQDFLHAAADLGRNANPLFAFDIHRERRHATFAHHLHFALDGFFEVLRVEVLPAHDQQVFQASGDKQFTVMQKAQIAGAQPGLTFELNEGGGAGFRVAPIAVRNARAAGPDFAHAIVCQYAQTVGLHDHDCVFRLMGAAAHDRAAVTGHDAVVSQRQFVQTQRRNALPALPACHKQRGLGQAIRGEIAAGTEPTGREFFSEALQGVLTDRLRTRVRNAPTAQVETGQRTVADPLAAQSIGEIRAAADGAAVLADGFQPAQRTGQKIRRRHEHARYAAEDWLQQAADQAHVVVQRQPADDHIVRVEVDAEAATDQQFVGHQVAVGHLHTFGQGRGA